jgi:hypothetical protein
MIGTETLYKNKKFRSMLDARWAAYFEKEGIEYEIIDGPLTFWLPQVKMFAVVNRYNFTEDEINSFKEAAERTGHTVLRLTGMPDYLTYLGCDESGYETDYLVSGFHGYCRSENRFYSMTEAEGMRLDEMRKVIKDNYGVGMKEAIEYARGLKL